MPKYRYDCEAEFEAWWEQHLTTLSNKAELQMAFEAGANRVGCQHNNTTMGKFRDWCHDCHEWVYPA